MKHCYTDCTITSDDRYRTRFDCKVCKRTFYQMKSQSSVDPQKGSLAGKTFLKDGTPYVTCENPECLQVERLHDSKKIRLFIPFNNTEKHIVKGWEKLTPVYEYVSTQHGVVRIVRERQRMVVLSVNGCMKCYNHQDAESRRIGKLHVYGANNTPKHEDTKGKVEYYKDDRGRVLPRPLSTAVVAPVPEVAVVPYTFPTSGRTRVQPWGETREKEEYDDKKNVTRTQGLYGPYNDRIEAETRRK